MLILVATLYYKKKLAMNQSKFSIESKCLEILSCTVTSSKTQYKLLGTRDRKKSLDQIPDVKNELSDIILLEFEAEC